jgi:topoisomerase-4 subunit B
MNNKASQSYTALDIEVLEGLEPVRKRPGMYIGGTDVSAMHHLVSEVFDNSMDEAVAGFANLITIRLEENNLVVIEDNGRGIPIDPHPKFPDKSALEVILTTLHSGGKFSGKAYFTSGGLHGVGISVVNALSEELIVEATRDYKIHRQVYSKGFAKSKLEEAGKDNKKTGTKVSFCPDPIIFGDKAKFSAKRLYLLAKSKAYLFKGVKIKWLCAPSLIEEGSNVPTEELIHFPGGIADYLESLTSGGHRVIEQIFAGEANLANEKGKVEWAVVWPAQGERFTRSYCNTVVTPLGGTHETGIKTALLKGVLNFAEMSGNKKTQIVSEDITANSAVIISLFLRDPQFQGQTKEKLVNREAIKLVENAIRDHFDNYLTANVNEANKLIEYLAERARARINSRKHEDVARKSITSRLRLPGKLTDCSQENPEGTEIFLVEGDSAGGSAKQARNRKTQAILPLRGKILNVASSTADKVKGNQEVNDIEIALGCGIRDHYDESALRYEKVIIMTDADVDGAHIAALLMTFFFQEMLSLIKNGHLYLGVPPLYRLTQGTKSYYALDEKERDKIVAQLKAKSAKKIEMGRFKGLGEMTPPQLKETTMNPENRILYKVIIDDNNLPEAKDSIYSLMGKKPELRLKFIKEQTALREGQLTNLDV